MIKVLPIVYLSLLLFAGNSVLAQTDTSRMEIQKQAVQMRETLNKYLSNQLLTTEGTGKPAVKVALIDSISDIISRQHLELELLKSGLKDIEKSIAEVRQHQLAAEGSDALVAGAKQIDENQLVLYFPFDVANLTPQQVVTLNRFIAKRKLKQIELSGYSDWMGSENYNKKLGRRRCNSVKQHIYRKDVKIALANPVLCTEANNVEPFYCRKVVIVVH